MHGICRGRRQIQRGTPTDNIVNEVVRDFDTDVMHHCGVDESNPIIHGQRLRSRAHDAVHLEVQGCVIRFVAGRPFGRVAISEALDVLDDWLPN